MRNDAYPILMFNSPYKILTGWYLLLSKVYPLPTIRFPNGLLSKKADHHASALPIATLTLWCLKQTPVRLHYTEI